MSSCQWILQQPWVLVTRVSTWAEVLLRLTRVEPHIRGALRWGGTASALDSVDDGAEDVSDGWTEQEQDGDHNNSHQN